LVGQGGRDDFKISCGSHAYKISLYTDRIGEEFYTVKLSSVSYEALFFLVHLAIMTVQ